MTPASRQIRSLDVIFAAYVLFSLVMVSFIAWGVIDDARRELREAGHDNQTRIGASSEAIAQEIRSVQHLGRLLVNAEQGLFHQVLSSDVPDEHTLDVADAVTFWFPGAFAFTLADASGKPVISDFKGSIGEACLTDLQRSAAEQLRLVPLHGLSSIPHFDISIPFETTGGKRGVLLVTFLTRHLVSLIEANKDARFVVELNTPEDHHPDDKAHADDQVLSETPVKGTNFVIYTSLNPEFLGNIHRQKLTRLVAYVGAFIVFASITGLLLWNARRRILFDADKLHDLNQHLYQQSLHDPLTGLANRRGLGDRFLQSMTQARRDGKCVAIAILDVDHFKRVNDQLGHDRGDECLKSMANILKAHCQRPLDMAIRMGGEEFLAIWYDVNTDSALKLARSIQNQLRQSPCKHADGSDITVSIGIRMVCEDHGTTQEQVLREVDQALYRAKDLGRDRIEWA